MKDNNKDSKQKYENAKLMIKKVLKMNYNLLLIIWRKYE